METKPYILASTCEERTAITSYHVEELRKKFEVVFSNEFENNQSKYSDKIVAIANFHAKPVVTKAILDKLPNLKIVAVVGVGYNHLDVELIRSYGVKISNTAGSLDEAVADFAFALLLAAGRDIYQSIQYTMAPDTTSFNLNNCSGDVNNTTLGIVGMGGIGMKIAKRATSFDMEILYHNRNRRSLDDETAVNATYYGDLDKMLPLCDYVAVAVCLTPETTKMFGKKQFQLMKKSAIFINVSRGAVVDQEALVKALKENVIQSAALDVTTPEPLPRDHDLLKLKNVIITSHQASGTYRTRLNMFKTCMKNMTAAINGDKVPNEIPY